MLNSIFGPNGQKVGAIHWVSVMFPMQRRHQKSGKKEAPAPGITPREVRAKIGAP